MAGSFERTQPGYRDNLDPWQQQALFELWARFFRLCNIPQGTDTAPHDLFTTNSPWKASLPSDAVSSTSFNPSSRKDHLSFDSALSPGEHPFSELHISPSASSQHPRRTNDGTPPKDDAVKAQVQGQQELKEMRSFLHKYGGQRLRKVFWQMVKGEHPDAIMLRFLRARKWDIDRALAILGAIAAWRVEEKVEEIVLGGEALLSMTRGGVNVHQNGISYAHGATINGEPIYIIEVGNHYSSSQTQEELKHKIILDQETLGSLMPPPVERKVVIFNMQNFSLRNMDYWCVFYLVKSMQKYPETLARVYVHGAPWIFKPVWAILRPLLDPVVRDKVRLTSDIRELEEYIPLDRLPKESMKGEMDWTFEWTPPVEGENDIQLDTAARDALQEEYFTICFQLERATRAVAHCLERFHADREEAQASFAAGRRRYYPPPHQDSDDASSIVGGGEWDEPVELASLKAKRDVLATRLRVSWLQLRPYMTGKVVQSRWNVVQPDGTVVWRYPKLDGTVEEESFGEATSLSSLSRNLDVIRRSMEVEPRSSSSFYPNAQEGRQGARRQPAAGSRADELRQEAGVGSSTASSASRTSSKSPPAPQNGSAALTAENLSYINGKMHDLRLPNEQRGVTGDGAAPDPSSSSMAAKNASALNPVSPKKTATAAATDADSIVPLPPSSMRADSSMSSADTLRAGAPVSLLPLSGGGGGGNGNSSVGGASVGVGAVETPPTSVSSVEEQRRSVESSVPVHPLSKQGDKGDKGDKDSDLAPEGGD